MVHRHHPRKTPRNPTPQTAPTSRQGHSMPCPKRITKSNNPAPTPCHATSANHHTRRRTPTTPTRRPRPRLHLPRLPQLGTRRRMPGNLRRKSSIPSSPTCPISPIPPSTAPFSPQASRSSPSGCSGELAKARFQSTFCCGKLADSPLARRAAPKIGSNFAS
jgi:hypothetical protein